MNNHRIAQKASATQDAFGWFAYLDGVMLRDKRGVGRRFQTEAAALKAANRSVIP